MDTVNQCPLEVDIQLNDQSVNFKLDSGADVSVLPASAYGNLKTSVKLEQRYIIAIYGTEMPFPDHPSRVCSELVCTDPGGYALTHKFMFAVNGWPEMPIFQLSYAGSAGNCHACPGINPPFLFLM